jgi:anthranilate phosphoribosyltransferase
MEGEVTDVQLAGVLVALRAKGPTVDEIAGFAEVMRARAVRVFPKRNSLIDTCGTGGDGAGTFNISTAAALVAAGAGVGVAKHGNRAMSSQCGSSDVLEALGVAMVAPEKVAEVIDRAGIGFMFAPAHHPATRFAVTARRELGVRTIFNLLGPLTNPAHVRRQVMGIYDPSLTETAAAVLRALGSERAYVVHGMDGTDEVSVCADTKVTALRDGDIMSFIFTPESVGIKRSTPEGIAGGTPAENAKAIAAILSGERGPKRDAVVLNAAFAITVAGAADSVSGGVRMAVQSIDSGAAAAALEALRATSASLSS